jgi:hypothetical protein
VSKSALSSLIFPGQSTGHRPRSGDGDRTTRRGVWVFLGWAGFVLALAGMTEWVFIVLPPPAAADVNWQFWLATGGLAQLGVPTLGLSLMLASAIALGRRRVARLLTLPFLVLCGFAVYAALLLRHAGPAVIEQGSDPDSRLEMLRGFVRVAIYAPGLAILAVIGWRNAPPSS